LPKNVTGIISGSMVKNLVYVSCNPATLGRDIKGFIESGFRLDTVEGVDMFPRTPHVETIAVLSR